MRSIDIDDYKGMSMAEFLINYANLDGNLTVEQVIELEINRVTHRDLTELGIPYIKRVPSDIVTEDDISSGRILIVYDFKSTKASKRRAPYLRPELVKEMEVRKMIKQTQDFQEEQFNFDEFEEEENNRKENINNNKKKEIRKR